MHLIETLDKSFPIYESDIERYGFGLHEYRLLINREDKYYFLSVSLTEHKAELLFIYTQSYEYDERFVRCELEGTFVPNEHDRGGIVLFTLPKSEG